MKKIKRYNTIILGANIFSILACYGIAFLLIDIALKRFQKPDADLISKLPDILNKEVVKSYTQTLYVVLVNVIILTVLSLFVKDKIEPTIWMVNVLLSGILFNTNLSVGIFIVWVIDNYIIKHIKKKYVLKKNIAIEMDNE